MTAALLHWYQCRNCKSTATNPIKLAPRCPQCRVISGWYGYRMSYLWSEAITTDEQRARAAKGIVQTTPEPLLEPRPKVKRCGLPSCLNRKPEAELVHLPGIGKYCSQACADRGQIEWDAFQERLRNLKERMPWLELPTKSA